MKKISFGLLTGLLLSLNAFAHNHERKCESNAINHVLMQNSMNTFVSSHFRGKTSTEISQTEHYSVTIRDEFNETATARVSAMYFTNHPFDGRCFELMLIWR